MYEVVHISGDRSWVAFGAENIRQSGYTWFVEPHTGLVWRGAARNGATKERATHKQIDTALAALAYYALNDSNMEGFPAVEDLF